MNVQSFQDAIFSVPSIGGTSYIGVVISDLRSEIGALFCGFFDPSAEVAEFDELAAIATQLVTPELIKSKAWRIIGRSSSPPPEAIRCVESMLNSQFVGSRVVGAGLVAEYLDTRKGLISRSTWPDLGIVNRFFESPLHVVVKRESIDAKGRVETGW